MPGTIVKFSSEDWVALDQLARERHVTLQELADEAFEDVLKKHGRKPGRKEPESANVVMFRRPNSKRR